MCVNHVRKWKKLKLKKRDPGGSLPNANVLVYSWNLYGKDSVFEYFH